MSYQIKTANRREIQQIVDWAAREGRNPGLQDAAAFELIDPQGFFVGYDNGEMVACASGLKYSNDFSFAGFYIVTPEERGKGYGFQIAQHVLDYVKETVVAIDGVVEQQENYKRLGFEMAHRNIRYVLEAKPVYELSESGSLRLIDASLIDAVLMYDRPFFPCARDKFLRHWLQMENARSLVYCDDGVVKAYGVIRQCLSGYKVGPLFADDLFIASTLFKGLCSFVKEGDAIYLDIPEINLDAKRLVEGFAMKQVFETARMYLGRAPDISLDRTFGITTFEVG